VVYCVLHWLDGGASQVFSFLGQEASLIGPSPKISKTMETPQNLMILFWNILKFFSFGPSIQGTIFAKAYGIKVRCYWEHTGEHVGRMDQHNWTYRELIENLMEHIGNKRKMKNYSNTHILKKKLKPLECMMHLLINACDIYFKYVGHFFFTLN